MKYFFLLLVVLLLSTFTSCDDDTAEPSIYEGCCEGRGEYQVAGAQLFIPNIFTANQDGINDIFLVFASDTLQGVQLNDFEVKDLAGQQLFYRSSIIPNSVDNAWDGVKPNGEAYEGKFFYSLNVVDVSGNITTIEGSACVLTCDSPVSITAAASCAFGLQHDGAGGFDPGLFPGEDGSNCIE